MLFVYLKELAYFGFAPLCYKGLRQSPGTCSAPRRGRQRQQAPQQCLCVIRGGYDEDEEDDDDM